VVGLIRVVIVSLSAGVMAALLLAVVQLIGLRWTITLLGLSFVLVLSLRFALFVDDRISDWEAGRVLPCRACDGRGYIDVYGSNSVRGVSCSKCKGTGRKS
jgi:hypothetical protein